MKIGYRPTLDHSLSLRRRRAHETIPTLAAAAAVTSRIRLTTAILISPFRGNGTLLAKQLATIDSFAVPRTTLDSHETSSPNSPRSRGGC